MVNHYDLPATRPGGTGEASPTSSFSSTEHAFGGANPRGAALPASSAGSGRRRRTAREALALVLAGALGSALTLGAVTVAQNSEPTGQTATPSVMGSYDGANWQAVAAKVSPGVVAITVSGPNGSGQGSGVIWDAKGDIVTNNHVVSGAGAQPTVQVRIGAQDTYSAKIVGTEPSTDLAVIRLVNPPPSLSPIARGNSETLHVGEPVLALGNPLGLSGTVTTGIVSALGRPVTTSQVPNPSPLTQQDQVGAAATPVVTDAIQTNAAINPGNSGGALVDANGRLIGINSAIASLGGGGPFGSGQPGNIGIGFAIPVHETESIADQLIANGHANVAYLGVSAKDATVTVGSATLSGAGIASVAPGSPAASAGLRAGDVVTAVDGSPVDGSLNLVGRIRGEDPTQTITLTIRRGDGMMDVRATLAPRPAT